ncbi:MAG: virulence factor TspB C-terminal domain-related protein [Nitrospiraceae bacterium]
MNLWQGSGLLSALNVLKTLTWPTTPPVYTLTSSTWGTYTIDFGPWAGMLTAIRSLIIAMASFVAYRIVFVGSK